MKKKFEQYVEACNYPGSLDPTAVESALRQYLNALGIDRRISRLPAGWTLEQFTSIKRSVFAVLERLGINQDALAVLDARDAREARAARAALEAWAARAALDARAALAAWNARDAQDALHRFASWCIQAGGWWYWRWELSWIVTTYFGSVQIKQSKVQAWAEPLLEAYIHGAWILYWTDDTLFWVAKPRLHKDATSGTRRLHHAQYAAVESDVENLYFWKGVLVPAFVVVKPEWITAEHIMRETNAQVRQVMVERVGIERVCQMCNAQALDKRGTYELLMLDLGDGRKRPYLKMLNPSVGVWHVEGVHPNCRTVQEALNWRNGLTPEQIDDVNGTDWIQQGDVILKPKGATKYRSQPIQLT